MIEDGSLWETLHRFVAPDYVVACVQVMYLECQALHLFIAAILQK